MSTRNSATETSAYTACTHDYRTEFVTFIPVENTESLKNCLFQGSFYICALAVCLDLQGII